MVGSRAESGPRSDGRSLRAQRNRAAIVDALFALVGEGVLEPTAQEVSQRAGVGLRSVFRHFDDMESLFTAMGERLFASVAPILRGGEPRGNLDRRGRDLVQLRVEFFERISAYKRSANLRKARSPFLEGRHRALVRQLRADVVRWLPELKTAPPALLEALDMATSFEAWDRLRNDQRLGRDRARAALECAVLALLAKLGESA